jgi:histidinol-phosphatase
VSQTPILRPELDLALQAAELCDALTLPLYEQHDFTVDWKPNRTEVTEVDRRAEVVIAEHLLAHRPDHGVIGEEYGAQGNTSSPWQWLIDPIDGTSGFVRRIPVWATLIALTHEEYGPVVGVISAPALQRRWWAARGLGAYANGRKCKVSEVDSLATAQVSITYNSGWDRLGLTSTLVDIQSQAQRPRGFGDFWQHCLVAEGSVDLAIDAVGVAPYDIAALKILVEEAGGTFTDRHGHPTHLSDTAISSNGHLHEQVIRRLTGSADL